MNVVVAIDSFKGSMTSLDAGGSVAAGIRRVFPDAVVVVSPLSDGGEGTVEALTFGLGGKTKTISVTGPLGRKVFCTYGMIPKRKQAIIEIAGAAGITLVPPKERNPLYTTTYGVGEVILDALNEGCRHFVVGIGGSATNDGGLGMLRALGFEFWDDYGNPVVEGALGLKSLVKITRERIPEGLLESTFRIACDVTNPLCGERGCSFIFGPQKGADSQVLPEMDRWLLHYALLAKTLFPLADADYPGSGAAGGLGFAFRTFLGAELESGIRIVLEETGLEDRIKEADLVVTGEGCLDAQTLMGKAPIGVAKLAGKYQKPVIAFSGCVTKDAAACNAAGIDAFFPILRDISTKEDAMEKETAMENLRDTAEQVFRLIRSFGK